MKNEKYTFANASEAAALIARTVGVSETLSEKMLADASTAFFYYRLAASRLPICEGNLEARIWLEAAGVTLELHHEELELHHKALDLHHEEGAIDRSCIDRAEQAATHAPMVTLGEDALQSLAGIQTHFPRTKPLDLGGE